MKTYLPPTEKKSVVERWEELRPLLPETLDSEQAWRRIAGSPFQKVYSGRAYEMELCPASFRLSQPELGVRFYDAEPGAGLEAVLGIAIALQPPKTRITGLLYFAVQNTLIRYVLETEGIDTEDPVVQRIIAEENAAPLRPEKVPELLQKP
ncbi:MAG TPA: hypothetical protein VJC21_05610 [Candidatus Nanoarchaeia archaeon]|nr:hypothetical protein [Candidatus Nanoarchaeia archaeon]